MFYKKITALFVGIISILISVRCGELDDAVEAIEAPWDRRRENHFRKIFKPDECTTPIDKRNLSLRLVEEIRGDWVIRKASSNYQKKDASTIHFVFSVQASETKSVYYTYRKEWK